MLSTSTKSPIDLQQQSSQYESPHSITSPSSYASYGYLTTPERSLRMKTVRNQFNATKKIVSRLQEKVKQLLDTQGLNVRSSLEEDLVAKCYESTMIMI